MSVLTRLLADTQPGIAQPPQPQQTGTDLMSTLADVGGAGLGAVASVGNFLDLPGSSVRDLLAGQNPLDQWLSPLSDVNRTSGRALLEKYGMRSNRETGLMGWLSDPGEGLRDLAGFAAEVVLDPFGPATKALAGTKALAPAVSLAGRAHPAAKAVGRGAKFIFDTIPEKMTAPLVRTLTSAGRGLRSLFDTSAEGITDMRLMDHVAPARADAAKFKFDSLTAQSELLTTADRLGFFLTPNKELDMSDPAQAMDPRSMNRVRAREAQIRRYLEGTYNPADEVLRQRDLVTVDGGGQLREVEYVNATPTGTQVKLVNDDTLYDMQRLQVDYRKASESIPEDLIPILDRMKSQADAVVGMQEAEGLTQGTWFDRYAEYFPRRKSTDLRQAEQIVGRAPLGWIRNGLRSLVDTLRTSGSRDVIYSGAKEGAETFNDVYKDKLFQKITEDIYGQATKQTVNGIDEHILPDMVSEKHIVPLAQALDRDPSELWQDLVRLRPVNKTGTAAYSVQPGIFEVVQGGQSLGQMNVRMIEDIAELTVPAANPDVLDDALQYVEYDLAQNGTTRLDVKVTPEIADVLKRRGYQFETLAEDGSEIGTRKLFSPGDRVTDVPLMIHKDEFKQIATRFADWQRTLAKDGDVPTFQPGRGGWKSWVSVKPGEGGVERAVNMLNKDFANFVQVDANTLKQSLFDNMPYGAKVEDYDFARAALDAGKEVYVGRKITQRGKPAEFMMITPMMKSQVDGRFSKLLDNFDDVLSENPLTASDATYSHVQSAIRRNYADRIDQFMPEIGERGVIEASSEAAVEHADSVGGWHKAFSEMDFRDANNKDVLGTKPVRTLLRLDDDSLKALGFKDVQLERIATVRDKLNTQVDVVQDYKTRESLLLKQDVSIGLVDRHKALAVDMLDNVERRFKPFYAQSAPLDQHDYVVKGAAAARVMQASRAFLEDELALALSNNPKAAGTLSRDLEVTYDPAKQSGITMEDAFEKGLFPERLDRNKMLENMRQSLVTKGALANTTDAAQIATQINLIKSLRLRSDMWTQLKTFNEFFSGEFPELEWLSRSAKNFSTMFKGMTLGSSPVTAFRDGLSSMVNATVMGGMNPVTAIWKFGKDAMSFVRGGSVMNLEPGIKEIDEYLASRGIANTAQSRSEAFQNFWNAYAHHGSLHPNVVTADADRMKNMEFMSDVIGQKPRPHVLQEFLGGVKRTILHPIKTLSPTHAAVEGNIFNWKMAGMYTKDELDRVVQRSTTQNPLVEFNSNLRGVIDNLNRAVFVMDRASKTGSLQDAFAAADKFLMNADPSKFTRFETKYLKAAIPFYSFMRQSLPLFMGEFLANPGGYLGMTVRATRLGQGGSDQYVPYQFLDSAAIPLGQTEEGNLKYWTSFGLMHEDAVKYAGNMLQGDIRALMQQVSSSASPLLKWWNEYSTNTSLFSQGPMGGRRLDDLDPSIGRILANVGLQDVDASGRAQPFLDSPMLESLAAAGPYSRMLSMAKIATDERSNAIDKVLRLLSGVRTEYVTQEMVTRDLRDRLNAIQIAAGARPLTTVSGTSKLQEHLAAQGDTEKVAVLQRIEQALAIQRKLVRDKEKMKSKPLIDMLQQVQ